MAISALPLKNRFYSEREEEEHIEYWKGQLNLLVQKKIGWSEFLFPFQNCMDYLPTHLVSRISEEGDGNTLLHLAIIDDRPEITQLLAKNVRCRSLQNVSGVTPLDLARLLNRRAHIEFLQGQRNLSFQSKLIDATALEKWEKRDSFQYSNHPVFAEQKDYQFVISKTATAKKNDEVPTVKLWLGIYFDKEIEQALHPRISIRWIDDSVGFGVFSEQKLSFCSFLGEYTGVISEKTSKEVQHKYYCVRYPIFGSDRSHLVIDAEEMGNFTRFINHSNEPNLTLTSVYWRGMTRLIFVTLKEIQEGDQLTFDYGSVFWKDHKQKPIDL